MAAYDEAIEKLSADVEKYSSYMNDTSLAESEREAAQALKTGFYGAVTTALEPMRAVFAGESTELPDYESMIETSTNYVNEAKDFLR